MVDLDLNFDDLEATFAAEAAEDVAALEAGLLALEDAPDDAEIRRELLRRVHTLKGNAATVGRQALAAFAHGYEERLEHLDVVDAAVVASLLNGVDTIRRLLDCDELEAKSDAQAASAPAEAKHIRVRAEKLNRMLDLAGEIAIARGRVRQLLLDMTDEPLIRPSATFSPRGGEKGEADAPRPAERGEGGAQRRVRGDALLDIEQQIDQLQTELQELIMRARMVPVGPLFRQYARAVRDTAAVLGKNARLTTLGDDVEIDTTAVELLRDPLTHMVRNAVDHGIEPTAERIRQGKPPVGHITLAAKHEAGAILITVSDDGAGLDRAAIAARARVLGLDAGDDAIFESGFTTSDEVTSLSGRGVGMDVVRRGIAALRGTISIESSEGAGTTFTIRLPLTLAVIDGFAVVAGDETWIVPMESVVECVELPADEPREAETGVLLLRGDIVPYARVRKLFGARGAAGLGREHVLVVQHGAARAGLVVDELLGSGQAVIKPLGRYFDNVPGIAGSSILGTGRVALILDTPTILRNLEQKQENA